VKISKSEFAARRKRLMSEMAPNSVAIIPAREKSHAAETRNIRFVRTAISFISRLSRTRWHFVLIPAAAGQVIMFCRDRTPTRAVDGYRQAQRRSEKPRHE
jgi:Xaa-Pro aminopeptidase